MLKINYWAIVAAAVAALVVGAVWYSPLLFGNAYLELHGRNPDSMADMKIRVGEMIGDFVRYLVVGYILARFFVLLGVADWKRAVQTGLWLWLGFQAMLLLGSVLHEQMPWLLYAIHAGDALVKTLFMSVILGLWRRH
jgi:Protein of unknown function (DUF1761)